MKIQNLLKNSDIPLVEAEILLANILKKDRSYLIAFPEKEISLNQKNKFNLLVKRRRNNEPLAYILGSKEFFGLNFVVSRDVLIPREETEELVDKALFFLQKIEYPVVVDVGTGSGCIAVSLAKNLPKAKIFATDTSTSALAVARRNARINNVSNRITFLQTNLLEGLSEKIDLVVANLPYIPEANYKKLAREILDFEPKEALFSFDSPNYFYHRLFEQAKSKLKKNGKIFYEVDGEIFEKS